MNQTSIMGQMKIRGNAKGGKFLKCECGKKMQPIEASDIIKGTVFCVGCKSKFRVLIADLKLLKYERIEMNYG